MLPDVQQTINVITDIVDKNGADSAAYWVLPNVILTLSGARAWCDSVFYSSNAKQRDKWLANIKTTLPIIKQHLPMHKAIIEDNKNPQGSPYIGYDLITEQGLKNLPHQTQLLGKKFTITQKTEKKILDELIKQLTNNPHLASLSQANLQHVVFGLMLGYPDIAVVETVKFWQKEDNDPSQHNFDEHLIDANIRGASYYECPQPVYSYPRHLINNPEIQAHEKLWSKILKDFYTSPLHQKLAKDPTFQKQIAILTKY